MKTIKKWALPALAALAAAGAAAPASAAVPTTRGWLNGTAYAFSYVTGSYNANVATIQAQPWWGNAALAAQSQESVKLKFGSLPTTSAVAVSGTKISSQMWIPFAETVQRQLITRTLTSTKWLTATRVNAPEIDGGKLPLTMLLLGLLYYVGLRRKGRAQA